MDHNFLFPIFQFVVVKVNELGEIKLKQIQKKKEYEIKIYRMKAFGPAAAEV